MIVNERDEQNVFVVNNVISKRKTKKRKSDVDVYQDSRSIRLA